MYNILFLFLLFVPVKGRRHYLRTLVRSSFLSTSNTIAVFITCAQCRINGLAKMIFAKTHEQISIGNKIIITESFDFFKKNFSLTLILKPNIQQDSSITSCYKYSIVYLYRYRFIYLSKSWCWFCVFFFVTRKLSVAQTFFKYCTLNAFNLFTTEYHSV